MSTTREVCELEIRGVTVGVSDSRVDSVRANHRLATAVRVYDGEHVGLASSEGQPDVDALTRAATEALDVGIPYAAPPEADATSRTVHAGELYAPQQLIDGTEAVLGQLRAAHPGFVLSNKIRVASERVRIQNDAGVDHEWSHTGTSGALVFKERGSPGIMDGAVMFEAESLDIDALYQHVAAHLAAYGRSPEPVQAGRTLVLFAGIEALAQKFRSDLLSRSWVTGSSLFDGSDGRFADDFTLIDSLDAAAWRVRPFDNEAVLRTDPNLVLVGEGRVQATVASKREAHKFEVPVTGNAHGSIHDLPSSAVGHLRVTPTAASLADLLGDRDEALFVQMSMGAECNNNGDFAMPVQLAFRVDRHGSLLHRTQPFTLTGNLFDMFGTGWVGATSSPVHRFTEDAWLATHMTVNPG